MEEFQNILDADLDELNSSNSSSSPRLRSFERPIKFGTQGSEPPKIRARCTSRRFQELSKVVM